MNPSKRFVFAWQAPAAAAAAVVPAGKSPLIQGLKHKILVHLLMKKQQALLKLMHIFQYKSS